MSDSNSSDPNLQSNANPSAPPAEGPAQSRSPGLSKDKVKEKRIQKVFLAATIIVAALVYLLFQHRASRVTNWPQDAEAQLAAAKTDGRPTVLLFMSDVADATSEHMAKVSLDRPLVVKALETTNVHHAMVVMNLGKQPEWVKQYKITKLPTVLKLSPAGRELKRHEDFIGEPDLAHFIQDAP